MEERKISTLVSLLGEDVLTEDCLVVVTGGNKDKEQNQNFEKNNPQCNNFSSRCPKPCSQKLLEKGENLPYILNKKYGKENYIIEDFYNFLIERNNEK